MTGEIMNADNEIIERIVAVRKKFDEIAASHSDDEAFGDCVISALGNNEFPSAEKVREDYEKHTASERLLKIGIVGAVKAGKSSLLNALFFDGKDILPKAARPMTAALTELSYGENVSISVDFFTENDIAKLKERSEQYERECVKLAKTLAEEKRQGWIKNQKRRNPAFKDEPTAAQISEWGESAKSDAKRKMQGNIFLAGAAQQYEDIRKASKRPDSANMVISAQNIDDIAGKLEDFVGSDGAYTPFTSKVSITLPLEQLKDISIVDTPGFNDPVPSRDERARSSLRECDVILILSPARQFLSANDKEVLSKVTTKNGIRELYIIQSQIDNQLFNLEIKDEADGDLNKAVDLIVSALNETTKKNLRDINTDGVFDSLINDTSSRSFPTSGICESMADSFADKASWDSGRLTVWKNLTENYPDYFSDGDESTSIASLRRLGNIEKIRSCVDSVKGRKQEIFKEKLSAFEGKYTAAAEGAKKEIIEYLESREKSVQEKNIKELEKEIATLSASYEKIKPELDEALMDTVYDWYNDVSTDFNSRLSASVSEAKESVASAEGGYTNSWTTGHLWWKEHHSEQITTANVTAIKNSIDDYIDDYNYNLPHYMETQLYRLTKKVMMAVQKAWTDNVPGGADSLVEIRNKTRSVMASLDFNFDLEYKGSSFSLEKKQNGNIGDVFAFLSNYGNSSKLEGSRAEECLSQAKSFVRDLNSTFRGMLTSAIQIVQKRCEKCNFGEQILDGYKKQLEKMKGDIEKPKLALENLRRIKAEVENL